MASKSKLEQAVEERTSSFNEAQRELVMKQLSTYRRNCARMADIDSRLRAIDARQPVTREEMRVKQAERSTLSYEYNQIATANSRISAELFSQLEDRD